MKTTRPRMPEIAELLETMPYGPAPEAPDRALAWLEGRGRRFDHWIGGEWRPPVAGERFGTANPATGEPLAEVAQGGEEDVEAAVRAAAAAQPAWWALGPHARARHLYALARTVQRNARLLSVLETLDNGKPIRESRDIDIPLVARHFYHHAGWAQLLETDAELARMAPHGVAGQVIPWNFPLLMLAWKVAPALATGNTVVLKPAEYTPLTALLFAELSARAGLPPGVLNVVTGDGRTGAALVRHPEVDKVAFTGSTEVGRLIREATAGSGKALSLELGGKSPFIVFEEADLDGVVEGVVDAIWFNQGEVCCAGSRLLVQESVHDRLAEKLRARMEALRMGDPMDKAIDIGAIVAPVQLERIRTLVGQGEEEGAEIWQPSWSAPREGWFYPPTLCTNVGAASTIAREEIFGPVVVMMSFRTPDESVALANDTRYGLAASVWTQDIDLALDVASRVKAGTVWINCTNVFDAASGFGGYRESGFGREGGREGLREYLRSRWEASVEERGARGAGPGAAEASAPSGDGADGRAEGAETAAGAAAAGAVEMDAEAGAMPPHDGGEAMADGALPPIDRTPKLYIGGRQVRPDADYSYPVADAAGRPLAEVPLGNRKDVRDAVEAARGAGAWAGATAHARAQVLYYLAENLSARAPEFADRIARLTGADRRRADAEVERAIERLYHYAAWADKWDGHVHRTPFRNVTLAMPEPLGVLGVLCPDEPALLGFVSAAVPALALGNAVVAVASERWPLPATDLYQVLETSDVPPGALNILTGRRDELARVLAEHDDVDGLWFFGAGDGDAEASAEVERLSIGNLKRTWVSHGRPRDWWDSERGAGPEFLHRATQIKNIWVPYGA